MRKRPELFDIVTLQKNLFVRQELNEDHALYLAELLENGMELPPIEITKDRIIIDGRHRIEAYELLNRKQIPAMVVDLQDEADLISRAYRSNMGGSLPPTPQDTEHTVSLLINRGESVKRIAELLGLPPGMTRKYITTVRSKQARQALIKASNAVTNQSFTVKQAAEQFGVDIKKLQQALGGNRKKQKENGVAGINQTVTLKFRSLAGYNAMTMKKLFEQLEDGDVTKAQVIEYLDHYDGLLKKQTRTSAEYRARLNAKTAKTD